MADTLEEKFDDDLMNIQGVPKLPTHRATTYSRDQDNMYIFIYLHRFFFRIHC